MNCTLCKKSILDYHPDLNHLKINESCEIDICSECINVFMKWQQEKIAKLFPTKAIKKRYEKSKDNC